MQKTDQTTNAQDQVGSPISNDVYDLIACLHAKLEGLEAIRKFSADGNAIWKKLSDLDNQAVQLLTQELDRAVKAGKLQLKAPGNAGMKS